MLKHFTAVKRSQMGVNVLNYVVLCTDFKSFLVRYLFRVHLFLSRYFLPARLKVLSYME